MFLMIFQTTRSNKHTPIIKYMCCSIQHFSSPPFEKKGEENLIFVYFLFSSFFSFDLFGFPFQIYDIWRGACYWRPWTGLRRKYFACVIITLPTIKAKKLSLSFFFPAPQTPENNFVSFRRPVCRCVILHWLGCIWRKWMHGSRRRRMDNSVNTSLETGSCQLRNPELT